MALHPRLDLRPAQSLTLTPQLRQAIKLLELGNLELADYLQQAVLDNPFLTLEDAESDAPPPPEPSEITHDTGDISDLKSEEYDNMWSGEGEETSWKDTNVRDGRLRDDFSGLESVESIPLTLREHLLSQLNTDLTDFREKLVGRYLVESVDDTGYLTLDLKEAALRLGCSKEFLEETLAKLLEFDPPGVCARSLHECLRMQLIDREKLDSSMERLLANLDLLAQGKLEKLAKIVGCDLETLRTKIQEIRSLDPKPGLKFERTSVIPVIPDVFVQKNIETGEWRVALNQSTLPRVLIDQDYALTLKNGESDKKTQKYLQERFSSANWLLKALDQRARTILNVSAEIVKHQQKFFEQGVSGLRPLALKDIALAVAMHESTVSRVTSHKYMSTPRGVFELKYFFTNALSGIIEGAEFATEAVRHRIKEMVDSENREKPYSDDQIMEKLEIEGITVARRTIAKYREALGIPSSYQRRRNHLKVAS